MRTIFNMLRRQDGRLSVARLATAISFLVWLFVTMYTLLNKIIYPHFDTLTIAVIVLFLVVLCSKNVDSKFITVKDEDRKENDRG